MLGLIAAGQAAHPATARGVQRLLAAQRGDGGWDEPEFTGTGFPKVFYLRYHYYAVYFPLLALARWHAASGEHADEGRSCPPHLAARTSPALHG
jgi:squalene-hopene/tetraprenyl-beta-curcumene cyclase